MRFAEPPPRHPIVIAPRLFGQVVDMGKFFILTTELDVPIDSLHVAMSRRLERLLEDWSRWPRGGKVFVFGGEPGTKPCLWELIRWSDGFLFWLRPGHHPPRGGSQNKLDMPGHVEKGGNHA